MAVGRTIRMVPGGGTRGLSSAGATTQEQLEESWAAALTIREGQLDHGRVPVSIIMNNRGIDDEKASRWSTWFEKHVKATTTKPVFVREANFSQNALTSMGARIILSLFKKIQANVGILKFYQNRIDTGKDLVDFLQWNEGNMRELHLSHNKLDVVATRDIIVTSATTVDSRGDPCYPRHGSIPLWLRLENNCFQSAALQVELTTALGRFGKTIAKTICEVDSTTPCTPGNCACSVSPPIHLTYLNLGAVHNSSARPPVHSPASAPTGPAARPPSFSLAKAKAQASGVPPKSWNVPGGGTAGPPKSWNVPGGGTAGISSATPKAWGRPVVDEDSDLAAALALSRAMSHELPSVQETQVPPLARARTTPVPGRADLAGEATANFEPRGRLQTGPAATAWGPDLAPPPTKAAPPSVPPSLAVPELTGPPSFKAAPGGQPVKAAPPMDFPKAKVPPPKMSPQESAAPLDREGAPPKIKAAPPLSAPRGKAGLRIGPPPAGPPPAEPDAELPWPAAAKPGKAAPPTQPPVLNESPAQANATQPMQAKGPPPTMAPVPVKARPPAEPPMVPLPFSAPPPFSPPSSAPPPAAPPEAFAEVPPPKAKGKAKAPAPPAPGEPPAKAAAPGEPPAKAAAPGEPPAKAAAPGEPPAKAAAPGEPPAGAAERAEAAAFLPRPKAAPPPEPPAEDAGDSLASGLPSLTGDSLASGLPSLASGLPSLGQQSSEPFEVLPLTPPVTPPGASSSSKMLANEAAAASDIMNPSTELSADRSKDDVRGKSTASPKEGASPKPEVADRWSGIRNEPRSKAPLQDDGRGKSPTSGEDGAAARPQVPDRWSRLDEPKARLNKSNSMVSSGSKDDDDGRLSDRRSSNRSHSPQDSFSREMEDALPSVNLRTMPKKQRTQDPRRQAATAEGKYVTVNKHSAMGCAVLTFVDIDKRQAVLEEVGDEVFIENENGERVRVTCQGHKHKDKEEVLTNIFIGWGSKVEKQTPLSEDSIVAFFDSVYSDIKAKRKKEKKEKKEGRAKNESEAVPAGSADRNTSPVAEDGSASDPKEAHEGRPEAPAAASAGDALEAAPDLALGGSEQAALQGVDATEAFEDAPIEHAASSEADDRKIIMVAVERYDAEADGYLSVRKGDHVSIWANATAPGDANTRFEMYCFGSSCNVEGVSGWLPEKVVWERYVDSLGRPWLYCSATEAWKWEDELHACA